MEKYILTSKGNGRENAQNDQTVINTNYMKKRFSYD